MTVPAPPARPARRSVWFALVFLTLCCARTGAVAADNPSYVLAVSWQPSFCEMRPRLPECKSQTRARRDATQFSLHGLWPEPRERVYCDVAPSLKSLDKAGRWSDLPALTLDAETRKSLTAAMPGARSFLHRHEWVKHGTCHEADSAEVYFRQSLRLLAELNASAVGALFTRNIGRLLTRERIEDAFDRAFGKGAGTRVVLTCGKSGARTLIVELRIALDGPIAARSLAGLVRAAPARPPGCAAGFVDGVGQ